MITTAGALNALVRNAWPMAAGLPALAPFDSVPSIARVLVRDTCTAWRLRHDRNTV